MNNTTVYLIRHSEQLKFNGEYNSLDNEQIKNEKIVLSVEGEEKARQLSKKEELKNIDAIYSSNYVRAICTAKYIAFENNLNINIDDRLGERKLGDLNELNVIMLNAKSSYTIQQLIEPNLKSSTGESNIEVRKRMLVCLEGILKNNDGKRIAIVSHGAAIKFLLQNWCNYNSDLDNFNFGNVTVLPQKLESPSILKLVFENERVKSIEKIV